MASNPHFVAIGSWREAAALVDFEPRVPAYTAGYELSSLAVFVRDHELHEVSQAERSLEAHYGGFMLAQSRPGRDEARRLALETRYGRSSASVTVAGREGQSYALGPLPEPDEVDGRAPAVVAWADGARFYLLASSELEAEVLLRVARSLHGTRDG